MANEPYLQAFTALYEQYADMIFRHCYLRLLDRDLALDIVQETFIRLWDFMTKGKEIQNAKAFLYRLAHNLIVDEVRRRKRRPTISLTVLEEKGIEPSYDPLPEMEQKRREEEVLTLLAKLSPLYRDLLVMRYRDGLSPQQIAEITGHSAAVVSVQLHRGIRKLRTFLHPHGQ